MRIPVYIAASSADHARARALAERLQETGLVRITGRWFDAVALHGVGNDHALTDEQQIEYAGSDLMAVDEAAVFVALYGADKSEGMHVEFGYVLGKDGVTSIAVGPTAQRCIFAKLADVQAPDDEHAFDHVVDLARVLLRPAEMPAIVFDQGVP